jgi:DNA-binding IclR family transcriptional regulator
VGVDQYSYLNDFPVPPIPLNPADARPSVKSASRVVDILSLLAKSEDALTLADVSKTLGIPRSSAHALLHDLVGTRMIEQLDQGGTPSYRIGVRSFEIGSAFLNQRNLGDEGRAVVSSLSAAVDDTAHLAILEGTDIVYIAKSESSQSMRLVSHIGARLPAHATAVGRVLLAHLSPETLNVLIPNQLPSLTPRTITRRSTLIASVAKIRELGWAFDDEESTPGIQCLAAPVYDHTGECIAGLSVSMPVLRMQAWDRDELLGIVSAHADQLSAGLGSRSTRS